MQTGWQSGILSCPCAFLPAGTRAGRKAGGRARMPARRQEGVPAIPTAKERDFRQGCITPPVRGSIWLRCGSLWRCSPAFAAAFPVASSVCTSFNPDRPVAFLPVCPRAGRQAQGQAGMQAEGQGCQPDGRPLRGSIWRRCGSLWRSSAPFRPGFTPYLCTQAAGQCSRRVPQAPAPSFFWAAGGYRATDTQSSRE